MVEKYYLPGFCSLFYLNDKLLKLKKENPEWFKDNIVEIFDFCFVRGLAKNPEDWADVIWYKNMLKDEKDGDTMLKLDEVRMKIKNNAENIKFGSRMGGSTILLPFGFVQWHQHAMQFHHRLKSIKELI